MNPTGIIRPYKTGTDRRYGRLRTALQMYRPVYKIARMAMKSEDAAVEAVRLTVLDSFAALACGKAYFFAAVHRMARKNTLH